MNTIPYFQATALSYYTIVFCQFVNILQRREERISLFNISSFFNRILVISIVMSIGLVALIIYGPYISNFLAFGPITLTDWMYIIGSAVVYLVIFEGLKLFKRIKSNS